MAELYGCHKYIMLPVTVTENKICMKEQTHLVVAYPVHSTQSWRPSTPTCSKFCIYLWNTIHYMHRSFILCCPLLFIGNKNQCPHHWYCEAHHWCKGKCCRLYKTPYQTPVNVLQMVALVVTYLSKRGHRLQWQWMGTDEKVEGMSMQISLTTSV